MNATTTIEAATLSSALAQAFAQIEAATKDSTNPAFKQGGKVSKYADLTAVIEAIKPALIANNLYFTQRPQPHDNGVCLETVVGHASGEELSLGTLFVPANKHDAQGFGSALTYARRYALVTAFGVPVEDDDGNAAARGSRDAAGGHSEEGAVSPRQQFIDDAQWATIIQLIEAAGLSTQTVCTAAKVASLKELPADKYPSVVKKLNTTISAKQKEPA